MALRLLSFAIVLGIANGAVLIPHRWREGKIVGGKPAVIDEAPYQVALLQNYAGGFNQVCGGSIISRALILTAAHCTDKTVASQWRVRAGSSYHSFGGQVIPVSQIIQHKGFTYTLDNDVSLMLLSAALLLGPKVAIVSLPVPEQEVADASMALATGWGYLKEGGSTPLQLYKVSIPILNHEICKDVYKSFNPVTNNMICAGYLAGQQDACQGDSGGPLVINNVQFGITSWGRGCARPNSPGVYTKVSKYVLWMQLSREYEDFEVDQSLINDQDVNFLTFDNEYFARPSSLE